MTTYEQLHKKFLNEYTHANYAYAVELATQMIELEENNPQGYIDKADACTMLGQYEFANMLRQIALKLTNEEQRKDNERYEIL